jgi:hypothetical protein
MANTLSFFMAPEDEAAFLRALEPERLTLYPEIYEPSFEPFPAAAESAGLLSGEAYYLALPAAGELVLRQLKRGPHAGLLEIDEISSPVFHFERSLMVDEELRSGRIWAELDAVGDRQHRLTKPDLMRSVFDRMRTHFKKRYRRSQPLGFFVGQMAARRAAEGLALREAGRKGVRVIPYR